MHFGTSDLRNYCRLLLVSPDGATEVIADMNLRVWKALESFLKRYYDLLQKRSKAG